jgi:hypothetical protein
VNARGEIDGEWRSHRAARRRRSPSCSSMTLDATPKTSVFADRLEAPCERYAAGRPKAGRARDTLFRDALRASGLVLRLFARRRLLPVLGMSFPPNRYYSIAVRS